VQNFKQCVIYLENAGFAKRLLLYFVPNKGNPRIPMMYSVREEIFLLTAVITYGIVLKREDLMMAFNKSKFFA